MHNSCTVHKGTRPMILDFHTHLFQPGVIRNREVYFRDPQFKYLYNDSKARILPEEDVFVAMDAAQVDFSVAMGFPWVDEEFCEEQNYFYSSMAKGSGTRILPFGSVPLAENISVERWVREISRAGLYGIGEIAFYLYGMTEEYEKYLRSVLAAACEYSLPVCLHLNEPAGHSYTGKYEPSFSKLYEVISDFPDAAIILAHWGGGLLFYELMPEVAGCLKNCYYDTAASPYLYENRIFKIALDIIGPGKILFGSDFPLIRQERYIDIITKNIPDKKDRDRILGSNGARILGLE